VRAGDTRHPAAGHGGADGGIPGSGASAHSPERRPSGRELVLFTVAALAFRAVVLCIDAQPRFFLGDSADYLLVHYPDRIPMDRSWAYGLAINAVIDATRSLTAIALVQSALSAAMCAGLAAFCRWLGARRAIAWAALAFASADPLLLYYDRSLMTDAPATVAIFAAIALSVIAVRRASLAWAIGAAASFWCATLLRTILVPLVMVVPLLLLVLAVAGRRAAAAAASPRWRSPRAVAAALVVATVGGNALYAHVTGVLTGHATLNARSGYYLIGVMAPILAPEDFRGSDINDVERILAQSQHGRRELRNAQVFAPDGIAPRLERALGGDWEAVSRIGDRAARRAVLRDPLGFAGLCAANARDYLSPDVNRQYFASALGLDRDLHPSTVERLRRDVREPVAVDMPRWLSPLIRWIAVTVWTMPVLALLAFATPGVVLLMVTRRAQWPNGEAAVAAPVLAVSLWTYLATVLALSPEPVLRYLLPLVPLLVALLALLAELGLTRLRGNGLRSSIASPGPGR